MADNFNPNPSKIKSKESGQKSSPKENYKKSTKKRLKTKRESGIPKAVADRMVRRVAFTTGLPTLSGMGVFVGSYFVVSRGIAEIPPGITLLSSAGCFLIGLIGLSYGLLSASWDESPGSFIGLENIRTNIGRILSAFKGEKMPRK